MGLRQFISNAFNAGLTSARNSTRRQTLKGQAATIRAKSKSQTKPSITIYKSDLEAEKAAKTKYIAEAHDNYEKAMQAVYALKEQRDKLALQFVQQEIALHEKIDNAKQEVLSGLADRREKLSQQRQLVEARYRATKKVTSFFDIAGRFSAWLDHRKEINLLNKQARDIKRDSRWYNVWFAKRHLKRLYKLQLETGKIAFGNQTEQLNSTIKANTNVNKVALKQDIADAKDYYNDIERQYNKEQREKRAYQGGQIYASGRAMAFDLGAFSVGAARFVGGTAKHMVNPGWRQARQGMNGLAQKINNAANNIWSSFVARSNARNNLGKSGLVLNGYTP